MDNEIFENIDYKAFEFVKTLGKGTHGTVILAEQKICKKKYAIKSIKKQSFNNENQLSLIRREVGIMASLSHRHIITVHDVCESSSRVTMTLEYASGGELFEYVNESPGGLDEKETKRIFNQISSAVHYLHKNGIVHRDLKLENILLDSNGDAKIADFGLANLYSRDKLLFTYCGSPLYASPEIVKAEPYFGPEVDCWSLGVILYAMSFGVLPFDDADVPRLRRCIISGEYVVPHHAPTPLRSLITGMLEPSTSRRLIMKEVVGHPWLNELDDITSSWPYYNNHNHRHDNLLKQPTSSIHAASGACRSSGGHDSCHSRSGFRFEGDMDLNCRDVDGYEDHLEGNLNKKSKRHHDFYSQLHGHPNSGISSNGALMESSFTPRSDWQMNFFPEEQGGSSVENSDREDGCAASVPLICEIKRPKHISLSDNVTIVCDCKTSSSSCLDATDSRTPGDTKLLTRTKSEPLNFVLPQVKSSMLMSASYCTNEVLANHHEGVAENMFEDSLNYGNVDSIDLKNSASMDCNSTDFEFVHVRRFKQLDSLENTDILIAQFQENDDNFSLDSLDA